jgi:tetratricopeptide (TPR) repeat protein
MLTLLSELKFLGSRDDELAIKDVDFGAFSVHRRKSTGERRSLLEEVKRNYVEKRSVSEKKVKSSLKHLEEALKSDKIVYCGWVHEQLFQLLLTNGLFLHVEVNVATGDIASLVFDKFLIGKIISEHIVDVIVTPQHMLISYNENQITFVHLQRTTGARGVRKIASADPKIFNIIVGSHGKKANRNMVVNIGGNLVLIWTKSSQNEFYPWRPQAIDDQERANLHIYRLDQVRFELVCYHWTENDPVGFEFSKFDEHELHSVEQKISRKGEISAEIVQYRLNSKSRIERTAVTSIPLQTEVSSAFAFSPDHEKLAIGCIDGSIVLFDRGREVTYLVKASFIPTTITWHPDSALIVIANDRAQLQCFDISLSCIKHQLVGEEMTPSNILDVSNFFARQPSLMRVTWSKKPDISCHRGSYAQVDIVLLMIFESGTFGMLKYIGGAGLRNDIHTSGLTADVIVQLYISLDQLEKAINILQCLNWDTYGAMSLLSLHKIASYIFKLPATSERIAHLQRALGSFHVPAKKLCFETENEFGDNVDDITRKFFHYLIRYKQFGKAFCLAIDINDADLFMILHKCAKACGQSEVASEAFRKAEEIYANEENDSHHSSCSLTSCSICSFSCESDEESEASSEFNGRNEYPPLPVFPAEALKSESIAPPLPATDEGDSSNTNELTLQNLSKFNKESSTHVEIDQSIGIPVAESSVAYGQWQPTTIHTYPLISGTIPSIGHPTTSNYSAMPVPITLPSSSRRRDLGIPTNSILSNPNNAREAGETKNKVKFSDTITVAVVPEIGRNEKIFNHPERVKHKSPKFPPHIYDPRRELAESLPLCHPHEDYLKDFLPMGKEAKGKGGEKKPTINIVNFGLL